MLEIHSILPKYGLEAMEDRKNSFQADHSEKKLQHENMELSFVRAGIKRYIYIYIHLHRTVLYCIIFWTISFEIKVKDQY